MLEKAQDKVVELGLNNVTLKAMDATVMDFGDSEFDAAVATYTISAVPDPVGGAAGDAPGGQAGRQYRPPEPLPQRAPRGRPLRGPGLAGVHAARLEVEPAARAAPRAGGLTADVSAKVNLFNGWRLIKCVNSK